MGDRGTDRERRGSGEQKERGGLGVLIEKGIGEQIEEGTAEHIEEGDWEYK